MDTVGYIAPLFVVGLAFALLGWAMLVLTSRLECERLERHPELSNEHQVAERFASTQLPAWIRFSRRWLLP
jgi:uncharacterized membrane protein YciS (DUF1049 family)